MISQERLNKFQNLPQNIQELLLDERHHLFLDDVAKQTNLNKIQRYWLSYAVTTIFLKEIPLNKISEYLTKELQTSQAKAFKISQLLYENLLSKYKEYFAAQPPKIIAQNLVSNLRSQPEKTTPRLEGNIVDLRSTK